MVVPIYIHNSLSVTLVTAHPHQHWISSFLKRTLTLIILKRKKWCCFTLRFCDCQWSWTFYIFFIYLSMMVLWQTWEGASQSSYYRSIIDWGPQLQHFEIHCPIYTGATPLMGCFLPMTQRGGDAKADPFLGDTELLCWLILSQGLSCGFLFFL